VTFTEKAGKTEVTLRGQFKTKAQLDKVLREFVFGSARLGDGLMQRGLFDEYRICLAPVVLGGGVPLFKPAPKPRHMTLLEARALKTGAIILRYAPGPVGPVPRLAEISRTKAVLPAKRRRNSAGAALRGRRRARAVALREEHELRGRHGLVWQDCGAAGTEDQPGQRLRSWDARNGLDTPLVTAYADGILGLSVSRRP
jgi:hypothetical protein